MSLNTNDQVDEVPLREWLVIIPDLQESDQKRPHLGKEHVDDMRPERGKLWLLGGMMLDEQSLARKVKRVTGNVIIARAASKSDLLEALRKDVYATGGVWNMEEIQIVAFESLFRLGLGFDK